MQRLLTAVSLVCWTGLALGQAHGQFYKEKKTLSPPPFRQAVPALDQDTSIATSSSILRYDTNHDGMVSLEEFNQVAEDNFHSMDKNGNGVLDGEDVLLRRQEEGRGIDWNNDGLLNDLDEKLEQQMWEKAKTRALTKRHF